jgi:hypothetical protein
LPSRCLCATPVTISPSYFFIVVTYFGLTSHIQVKDSAAHCQAVFFSYVFASDYFWLCGLTIWFNFGVLELHVVAVWLTMNDRNGRPPPKKKKKETPAQQEYSRR